MNSHGTGTLPFWPVMPIGMLIASGFYLSGAKTL
jgi:hypothetical protein